MATKQLQNNLYVRTICLLRRSLLMVHSLLLLLLVSQVGCQMGHLPMHTPQEEKSTLQCHITVLVLGHAEATVSCHNV
jgi:hypothetical protein